jgi:hypothetical protein
MEGSINEPEISDLYARAIWQAQPVNVPDIPIPEPVVPVKAVAMQDTLQPPVMSDIKAPDMSEILPPAVPDMPAPEMAGINVPEFGSPGFLDVRTRMAQPEMPGVDPLSVRPELSQFEVPEVSPLGIRSKVLQPVLPEIGTLGTSLALEDLSLPDIPNMTASMEGSINEPEISDLYARAIWQAQPVNVPDIPIPEPVVPVKAVAMQDTLRPPDMPDLEPLTIPGVETCSVGNADMPDLSKVQDSGLNFELPANLFHEKKQEGPQTGKIGNSGNNERKVIIQNLTVTLPGVNNADSFVAQVKRMVDGIDG